MKAALHKFQLVLAAYGPWGIFLLSVVDSFGVPLPGALDFLLIGVAAASAKEPSHAYFTAVLAIIGSVIGNTGLYLAARRGAGWLAKAEPPPGKRRKFREWFHRYGLLTVFVPAVTPVVPFPLKVFVASAGALKTPYPRFIAVILAARIIRYGGEAWLGLELGEEGARTFFAHNGWTLAGVAAALCAGALLLVRYLERRRSAERVDVLR